MLSGAEIWPHSQWNLYDFFPNFENISIFKNKNFFFLNIGIFIQSDTHTSYMVTFSVNLMGMICVIAKKKLIDQK